MAVRSSISTKEESKEPDYNEDEDRDQLEEEQEEKTGEQETTNQVFLKYYEIDGNYNDAARGDS